MPGTSPSLLPCVLGLLTCQVLLTPVPRGSAEGLHMARSGGLTRYREPCRGRFSKQGGWAGCPSV